MGGITGISSAVIQNQIGVAVLGKALDTVKDEAAGLQKLIADSPKPATSGYGDILDVLA